MSFIWQSMLWSLVLIPLLMLIYFNIQQQRKQIALRYGSLGLVKQSSGRDVGMRRHIPALFFLVGLTVLFIALAFLGFGNLVMAIAADVGVTLIVILSSLNLMKFE